MLFFSWRRFAFSHGVFLQEVRQVEERREANPLAEMGIRLGFMVSRSISSEDDLQESAEQFFE